MLNAALYSLFFETLLVLRRQRHFKFEIKIQPSVLSATSYFSQRAAPHSLESSAGRHVPKWIHV